MQTSPSKRADLAGEPCPAGEVIGIEQLRAVFENYSGGMAYSRDGIFVDANPGLARILGTTVDQLVGRPILDFIAPEDRQLVQNQIAKGRTSPYEHRVVRADGTLISVEASASIVGEGPASLRFTVVRDISDRKRDQEELDRQRRLLQTILDHMPAGVFVADVPSGRPVLVNEFSRKLLRKTEIADVPKERLAIEYSAFVAGTNQPYPFERMPIVRAMTGECSTTDDTELRFDDGTSTFIQIVGAPIYDAAGKIVMSVVITQDITARKQAEDKLHAEQDFLRELIKAHERDRQLMAYEIHDGLVQYITAAVWRLDAIVDNADLGAEARASLVESQRLLRKSIVDARRVLSGLRPPVLDEQGILAAIDYLVAESDESSDLQIKFDHDVQFQRLEPLLEGAIFRIVQESLTNIRKHSKAKKARVQLTETEHRLHLLIEDDGCGFRQSAIPPDRFGLQGIRKRAELLGGTATIDSAPGKGTRIFLDLPILPLVHEVTD